MRFARGTVKVDYWIAVSEKVGTERLIHEGTPVQTVRQRDIETKNYTDRETDK